MRWLALFVVSTLATTAACASVRRPRCPADAQGDAASERDELLVKHLIRSFYHDDFAAFQRLQPTESQYATLSWRFGAAAADAMMGVIRDPVTAKEQFEAKRQELSAQGIDPRTARRCTRVVARHADEPRVYTIDIAFGEGTGATHLRADVFDSEGRVAMVGGFARPGLASVMNELYALTEGFFNIIFELGPDPSKALPALRAFRDENLARYQSLLEIARRATLAHPEEVAGAYHEMTQRMLALLARWKEMQAQLEGLQQDPEFQAILSAFTGIEAAPEPLPTPTPSE